MPHHVVVADRRRHLLPLPEPQRAQQPFVIDARTGRIIAPWAPKRGSLADEERLDRTLARIEAERLPASLCWCWPNRDPVPVTGAADGWLRHWSKDRAVYRIAA
jgi:hypothetical protein